jgi:hypothetical protein
LGDKGLKPDLSLGWRYRFHRGLPLLKYLKPYYKSLFRDLNLAWKIRKGVRQQDVPRNSFEAPELSTSGWLW